MGPGFARTTLGPPNRFLTNGCYVQPAPSCGGAGIFDVAVMDAQSATGEPVGLIARLRARLSRASGGTSEASLTRRLAGTIFLIRVISAGLAYFSQILLARWMGTSDYGIYVY